jgi:hypothetical protein
VDFRNTIKS